MPWEHDRYWIRSYNGAGSQLLDNTTHLEPHHIRSGLSAWGGKEEEAQEFPWSGQEGQRASVCAGADLCAGLEPASGSCSSSPFP